MDIVPDFLGHFVEHPIPNPPVGEALRHTVTPAGRWLINSIVFVYKSSNAAGERFPFIRISTSNSSIFSSGTHFDGLENNTTVTFNCFHTCDVFIDLRDNKIGWLPIPHICQISGTFEISVDAHGMHVLDRIEDAYIHASYWQEH